jgi:uncharacterized protein YjgD (DUF1641 family)
LDENLDLSPEELRTLREFLNFGRALVSSVTSSQIASVAAASGQIAETINRRGLDRLIQTVAECSDSLAGVVRLVDEYYRSGTIKNALDMIAFLGSLKDALSAHAVARMAEGANRAMSMADQVTAVVGGLEGAERVARCAVESAKDTGRDDRTIGTIALLRSLKEPQVQRGIKFLLHMARRLNEEAGSI